MFRWQHISGRKASHYPDERDLLSGGVDSGELAKSRGIDPDRHRGV